MHISDFCICTYLSFTYAHFWFSHMRIYGPCICAFLTFAYAHFSVSHRHISDLHIGAYVVQTYAQLSLNFSEMNCPKLLCQEMKLCPVHMCNLWQFFAGQLSQTFCCANASALELCCEYLYKSATILHKVIAADILLKCFAFGIALCVNSTAFCKHCVCSVPLFGLCLGIWFWSDLWSDLDQSMFGF